MTYDSREQRVIVSSTTVDLNSFLASPSTPPGMTSSKSSKTSSLRSFGSDDDDHSTLHDGGHFEEIGLDDDAATMDAAHSRDAGHNHKITSNPYSSSSALASDLRVQTARHMARRMSPPSRSAGARSSTRDITTREITSGKVRPKFPSLSTQFRDTSTANLTSIGGQSQASPLPMRNLQVRSASTTGMKQQKRSASPSLSTRSVSPRDANKAMGHRRRRSSWQTNRERRLAEQLEKEYEEDDDFVPEGFILDNIPISPRPPTERSSSRPSSVNTSPERQPKERVRSVGNGTPAIATAQGSLRSPGRRWDGPSSSAESKSPTNSGSTSPFKGRARSWNSALSELSAEAKALTEKLEEHADGMDNTSSAAYGIGARPVVKPRVKSALAELPPLRRSNIMIDPLPISKEKEAVLSRTRPSWLPPKNPTEEKKHVKEYQRMMASSIEADRRREVARQEKEKMKDCLADSKMRVWEDDVLARWDAAVRERKTRELWWRGVAPRCRGKVWAKAIGNELGLSDMGFNAALSRARDLEARVTAGKASSEDERKAGWFRQIRKDVDGETWPELKIFQKGGPLFESLVEVLMAYAMYRSDIGYVEGCNTIAALLLLNLTTPASTFIALANLLNRSLPLSFYACDPGAKASAQNLVLQTVGTKFPRLHTHLASLSDLGPDELLSDLVTGLFTRHLTLDEATRLWDVYVFEGDSALLRAAVALLGLCEAELLDVKDGARVGEALVGCKGKAREEERWIGAVREAGKS